MITSNVLRIALVVFLFGLHPGTKGQVFSMVPLTPFSPRPLCNYQMALANQACAYLPFTQVPPPAPRALYDSPPSDEEDTPEPEPEHEHRHRHSHRHDHDEDPDHDSAPDGDHDPDHDDDHDHDPDGDGDHDHDPDHDGDHDSDHDSDQGHEDGHGHKHRHEHGHKQHHHHHRHQRHRDTPVEEQCCKWLAQVDDQCVCELLVHLPPFLARPVHNYSVIIGGACSFTFSCGSRLRK